MAKSRQDIDSIRYKLDHVFEAYGKTVSDSLFETWLETLDKFTAQEITAALADHLRGDNGNDSKYAPRPKHIADLCERSRERGKSFQRTSDEPQEKPASPTVAKAWVICMRKFYGWSPTDANPHIDLSFERALEIVNAQAAKFNNPEAIPDEYKLSQYWGQQDELVGF